MPGGIGRGRVCGGRVGGGEVLAAAWWDSFASPDPEHPAAATSGQAAAAAYWESLSAEKQRLSVKTITFIFRSADIASSFYLSLPSL